MANKLFTKSGDGYVVGAGENSAIVQFAAAMADTATLDIGKLTAVTPPNNGKPVDIMYWGAKNNLPFVREELITGNNIVPTLIERKRNIICGQGWQAYTEAFVVGNDGKTRRQINEVKMPDEVLSFFEQFNQELRDLVGELLKHNLAIPEFLRSRDGKIVSVKSLEVKNVRAGKKDKSGAIREWWWSNYWVKNPSLRVNDKVLTLLPVYNADKKQPRFILPLADGLFNDGYYPIPAYWGGRHWITLSNIIPLFHEANLKHGATPRFHIVIPNDFFFDYERMNRAGTEEERAALMTEFQAKELAFVDDLNTVLTGIGNSGRMIVSKSELVEVMGGRLDKRITIEEVKFDFRDEALLKLFSASNVANVSAQGLHPTLASIETAGKGIGSGTEIRNAFLLHLIIAAPAIRELIQRVIKLVKRENGWPAEIHYTYRDAEMTTLAENPAGVQQSETNIGA